MKRSFRDKWVSMLRSGEYEQTATVLCNAKGARCCLGVAYDVEPMNVTETINHRIDKSKYDGCKLFDSSITFPEQRHMEEWGLSRYDAGTLANMNDNGNSFNQIADWIEQNVSVIEG